MTLAAERELLRDVLDTLVPAGDGFPGAGEVALEHVLAVAAASAEADGRLGAALRAIREAAGALAFAALGVDEREGALRRVEQSHSELFEALVRHTYDGYYSHPIVVARLGLDPGPVHPRGHRIDATDLPDLARVSARGPLYRPA